MTNETILVIEDDPTWQMIFNQYFSRLNLKTIEIFDYSDALFRFERLESKPLLATLDLRLDDSTREESLDGILILNMLRKHRIYTVVLSGYIRPTADVLKKQPIILELIDKIRFVQDEYKAFFDQKIQAALERARADRWAEGQTKQQQQMLAVLPKR